MPSDYKAFLAQELHCCSNQNHCSLFSKGVAIELDVFINLALSQSTLVSTATMIDHI